MMVMVVFVVDGIWRKNYKYFEEISMGWTAAVQP